MSTTHFNDSDSYNPDILVLRPSFLLALKEFILLICSVLVFVIVNYYYYSILPLVPFLNLTILEYIAYFFLFLSVLCFIILLIKVTILLTTSYRISNETIEIQKGVFSINIDPIELYRIKDYKIEFPFFLRVFKLGQIRIFSSDRTNPLLLIKGVKDARGIYKFLRQCVENERTRKGVREID